MTMRTQDTFLETLRSIPAPPVLVFVNSIAAIENLVAMLRLEQFHVCGIHSEYPQELRAAIVRAFREGGIDVLVCASLLERGIDFDVDEVILYEVPDTIEKVKHRAGRTGRGGRKGRVTVLITKECKILGEYKRLLKSSRQVWQCVSINGRSFLQRLTPFSLEFVSYQTQYLVRNLHLTSLQLRNDDTDKLL